MKEVILEAFKHRLNGEYNPVNKGKKETYSNNMFEEDIMFKATQKELASVISSFKNNKATGPRQLKFELIKNLSQRAQRYILIWVNTALKEAKVDPCLNTGVIKLLYKKDDPTDPLNYRPINVAPILSKVITKIINIRLVELIEERRLLDQCQIGFRPNYSTRDGVFMLGIVIEKAKRTKQPMVLTFVDLKGRTTLWTGKNYSQQ